MEYRDYSLKALQDFGEKLEVLAGEGELKLTNEDKEYLNAIIKIAETVQANEQSPLWELLKKECDSMIQRNRDTMEISFPTPQKMVYLANQNIGIRLVLGKPDSLISAGKQARAIKEKFEKTS